MSELALNEKDSKIRPSTGARRTAARISGLIIYERCKRFIDCLASGLGILLLSPFFALLAIAIKLESPGPILFSQTRLGQGGTPFKCWKFRSMFVDAEQRKLELLAENEMDGGHSVCSSKIEKTFSLCGISSSKTTLLRI